MPVSEELLTKLRINPTIAGTLIAVDMGNYDITSEAVIEAVSNFSLLKSVTLDSKIMNSAIIQAILKHNTLEKVVIINEETLALELERIYDMYRHLAANAEKNAAESKVDQAVFVKDMTSEPVSHQLANLGLNKSLSPLPQSKPANQEDLFAREIEKIIDMVKEVLKKIPDPKEQEAFKQKLIEAISAIPILSETPQCNE